MLIHQIGRRFEHRLLEQVLGSWVVSLDVCVKARLMMMMPGGIRLA
jgi:hypothetical protein